MPSKKPLVLHVIDSLDSSGGAEQQLISNLHHFDSGAFEHRLTVIRDLPDSRRREVPSGVEITSLFGRDERPARLTAIRRLRSALKKTDPSIVHASLALAGLASRLATPTSGPIVVESLVNLSHEPVRVVDNPGVTTAKLRAHRLVDSLTMRRVAAFHAISRAVADSWSDTVGIDRERIRVIPRAITVADYELDETVKKQCRAQLLRENDFPDETFLVASVGRIEPQKGHIYLIRAVAKLAASLPNLRLVIAGRPGASSAAVEEEIDRLGLRSQVRLIGAQKEIGRVLGASDVFAYPSLFEGFGVALLEAMAARVPIVSTDCPPISDLISDGDEGLLVPTQDTNALADSILKLANSGSLRTILASNAHRRLRSLPTPSGVAASFEEWYSELMIEHRYTRVSSG